MWRLRRSPGVSIRNGASAGANRTVNQNVLPRPKALSTPISPPISSTIWRAIARPSPVPPQRRPIALSIWENG